jgi:hypothetical protein
MFYKAEFDGYLFTPYCIIVSVFGVLLGESVMKAQSESYGYCPHDALGQ